MELYQQILIYGSLILLALLAVLQLTGYIMHSIFLFRGVGENKLIPFHGLLFWVMMCALITTGGKSICWAIALYFFLVLWMPVARRKTINLSDGVISVLSMWLFALIPFLVFYNFTFRHTNTITLPYMDEVFYTKVASMMIQSGVETNLTQSLWFDELAVTTPYHYFELWLTGMLQRFLADFPSLFVFKLLAVPVILGISLELLYATASSYGLKRWQATIAVLVFLFCGLFLGYTSLIGTPIKEVLAVQLHYISDFIVLNRTKLATVLLFVSAAGLLYAQGNKYWYMPLICLSFLWVTVMPSILSMVAVGLLVQHRSLFSKAYLLPLVYFVLSIGIFWYLYLSPFSNASFDNAIVFFQYTGLNMLAGTIIFETIAHGIILLPAILLSFWMLIIKRQRFDTGVFLWLVPVLVGVLLHTATVGSVDSFQFVSNISAIALPLVFFYLMIAFFSRPRNKYETGFVMVLITAQSFYTIKTLAYSFENYNETYGSVFIEELKTRILKPGNKVVTLIVPKGGHHDAPFTNIEGAFFLAFDREAKICQLNAEIAVEKMSEESFASKVAASPFLYFCNKTENINYDQCRIAFLKQLKPDFLVVNAAVDLERYPELHPYLGSLIVDPISRTRVYNFKKM